MTTLTIDDAQSTLDLMQFILMQIDPTGKHFFALSAEKGYLILKKESIQVVFLDIEMPDISGEEVADYLLTQYPNTNLIFITGHPEYAMLGHKFHCSSFVSKPFGEEEIRESLKWLRIPANFGKALKIRCPKFALFSNGKAISFNHTKTMELVAYLVYKEGAIVTNDEIITALWAGNPDKADLLRQYVKDLRDRLDEIGAGDALIKKRGKMGIKLSEVELEGNPFEIFEQYRWIV